MAKRTKPTYAGLLAERIPEFRGGYISDFESFEKWVDDYEELIEEKLLLLLDHYGIERDAADAWKCLTLRLAREVVPGFRVVRVGAPRKWTHVHDALARLAIDEHLAANAATEKMNVLDAARHVVRQRDWKIRAGPSNGPANVLRQAYFRADAELVDRLRDRDWRRLLDEFAPAMG